MRKIIAGLSLLTVLFFVNLSVMSAQDFHWDPLYPPVHDPVAAYCDGSWYLFSTGHCISIMKSDDMKSWLPAGQVFESAPQWALDEIPGYRGHTWAPDIYCRDGIWYLYYSCSDAGKNTSAIGVATNRTLNPDSPDYRWEDHGCLVKSVTGRDNWNAIDPNLIIDENGTGWLSFGSFWSGIKLVRLDETLCRVAEPQEWWPLCRRPEGTAPDLYGQPDDFISWDERGEDFNPGNDAVEAPFIVKRGEWYYLFVSYDLCCRGPKSTYRVVAGRSRTVNGPYVDAQGVPMMQGGGTPVVSGSDRYPGVGHCAVVSDGSCDWLFFHAYDRYAHYNSRLLIRKIEWDADGWPSVTLP